MSSEWTPTKQEEWQSPKNVAYCHEYPKSDPRLDEQFTQYLSGRAIRPNLARHNFWYPSTAAGDSHPRVVIPGTSWTRANKFWQARYMGQDPAVKRYMSPAAARGDSLVLCYPIRPSGYPNRVALVEGPFDALACAMEGLESIALMGSMPSDEVLLNARKRMNQRDVLLVADADAADKMIAIMNSLVRIGYRGQIRVVSSYPYKDIAEAPWEAKLRILDIGGRSW